MSRAGRVRTCARPGNAYRPEYLTDEWLPAIKVTIEESTWASCERYLRLHVIPHLGGVRIEAIDAGMLNRLYADLLHHGRLDGKPAGLSRQTVRYVHTVLGRALSDAVRWGRIIRNPAQAATPPRAAQTKTKAPEMRTWDADTLGRFLDAERGTRYQVAFLFLATTGCRAGRLSGCAGRMSTSTPAERRCGKPSAPSLTGSTRSRRPSHTERVIDLDADTAAALRSWRTRQAEERLLVGPGYDDRGIVFCRPDGRPCQADRLLAGVHRRPPSPATASPASVCTTSDTLGRRSLCRPAST